MNIANFKNIYFENHLRTVGSDSSYILHIAELFRKPIGLPDWPFFLWKHKITLFYLLSLVFTCFITRCHSLSYIVLFCYSLSFLVIHCHSLSLAVPLAVTRCHWLYHSLPLVVSLVVIRCTTGCITQYHSLSLVVIHCTTCWHSLSLVVIRCHSMYHSSEIFCFLHHI